jgi:hypothetical protein
MTRSASLLGKREFLFLWCVAVGLLWAQPAAGQERRADMGLTGQPQIARSPKLSPLLAGTLKQLDNAGVTRGTVDAYAVEQFSTSLVHLNQQGEIQVEIDVERLDDATLSELRSTGVTVEQANVQHRVIQGWVPFELLEGLTQLTNVKRIRPPAYAVPRGQTAVSSAANRR